MMMTVRHAVNAAFRVITVILRQHANRNSGSVQSVRQIRTSGSPSSSVQLLPHRLQTKAFTGRLHCHLQ